MIHLVHVKNPLQPYAGRELLELESKDDQNLRGYVIDASLASEDITVSLNGTVITDEQSLAIIPRPGDSIVVAPRLQGGSLMRTLATVAVLAAAAVVTSGASLTLAGFTVGFTGLGLGATASALVASGITLGGNLLISAIAGLFTPAQKQSTPSYAFDGPHSLAQAGSAIPKGYGKFMWGGNVIASFIDVEGQDQYLNVLACYGFGPARAIGKLQLNNKDIAEYQNVQYSVRYGLNDQTPIPAFNRIVNGYPQAVQCLAGVPVIIPGTGDLTQALQVDIQFPAGIYYHTNDGNIIEAVITYLVEYCVSGTNNWQGVLQPLVTVDVVSYDVNGVPLVPHAWAAVASDQPPTSGIVYALDDGPHTPGDPWTGTDSVETFQPNGNHSTIQQTFHGNWEPTDVSKNQILVSSWTNGYQDYVGASTQTLYNRTSIYGLTPGKYDVRVTKYGSAIIHQNVQPGDNFAPTIGQDMWVHSVNEIAYQDLAYPNMVLVGVRALATGQLAGSNLNITAEITHGLRTRDHNLLPAALLEFEEDNPACVVADMMLDRLYGGGQFPGVTLANINRYIDEWVTWAGMNEELVDDGSGNSIRRHVFNGVFDSESDLWSSVGVVTQMSRATVLPLGRDYGVFVDAADTPVQMFTAGNSVQDSFTETWLELDARANQVEVQFADATRNYKQDNPIAYMDPANQNAGVAIKNVRIDAKGVTLPAQAWHLAYFRERNNQFLLRSGNFNCDVDAIACRPGNVIILQSDVPEWGWGGRTLPGSTAAQLIMDRTDLAFVPGTAYSIVVLFPAIQRYTGTVTAAATQTDSTGYVIGVLLTVPSFDGISRVTRAVLNGIDCLVLSAIAGGVTVKPAPGFTPGVGQTCVLFDTDVLLTAPVAHVGMVPSSDPGTQAAQTVTLSVPFPKAPEDFSTYFYGPTGSEELARVTSIRKSSDFKARIDWVDYDDRVYIDATPTIGEVSAITVTQPGVTSLTGAEIIMKNAAGINAAYIQLSWVNGRDTAGVAIYASVVSSGLTVSAAPPKFLIRIPGLTTSFKTPGSIGQATQYKVVGFDANDVYANINSAPSITVTAVGVSVNLIYGSSFQSGFAFWNRMSPRSFSDALNPGDIQVPGVGTDGQGLSTYQADPSASAISTAIVLLEQTISPATWSVGDYLILSAYLAMTGTSTGGLIVDVQFIGATAPPVMAATLRMGGGSLQLNRFTSGVAVQVPAGTTALVVRIRVDSIATIGHVPGHPLSINPGDTLTISRLQLEEASALQNTPTAWTDIDIVGQVRDFFQLGLSSGARAQGSTAPTSTGSVGWLFELTSIEFLFDGLTINWPDGGLITVALGNPTINGLASEGVAYWAYLYFNVFDGTVNFAAAGADSGSPQVLFSSPNTAASIACNMDGRIDLTPGGLQVTTGTDATPSGTGSATNAVVWMPLRSA